MSERPGEFEQAVIAACDWVGGRTDSQSHTERRAIAAAIDRLAADVAAVKDLIHEVALSLPNAITKDANEVANIVLQSNWDAAIIDRDKARAEVTRLKSELAAAIRTIRELQADRVERQQPAAPQPASVSDAQPAMDNADYDIHSGFFSDRGGGDVDWWHGYIRSELARCNHYWRRIVDQQPAAPPPGWLTVEERANLRATSELLKAAGYIDWPKTIDAILSLSGSPPVVEVPAMVFGDGSYAMQRRYRAAMDKVGVAWKEV